MFNRHFTQRYFFLRFLISCDGSCHFGAIDSDVYVSCAGNFEFLEAGDGADSGDNFFGNFAGRFAKSAGKFESDGERILSELDFRGLLDHDVDVIEAIGALKKSAHRFA
jgi:hypothetical protein